MGALLGLRAWSETGAEKLYAHVIQGALPLAVNALAIVGSDDDVAQCGSVLEHKDSISITAFRLIIASGWTTVPLVQATVEGGTSCNGLDGGEVGCARGVREGSL